MRASPIFSVILPTYNRASFISNAIHSVIDQGFEEWELIVVDDGSTDETRFVVEKFDDKRIRYFYITHGERSRARNFGIEQSQGIYICFLDSDDRYFSNHLSVLHDEIKARGNPKALFTTSSRILKKSGDWKRPLYTSDEYEHPVYFVWQKFLLINSVCIHTSILEQNQFPEQFNVWEDTHLWLRIVAVHPFVQINEVTTEWNVHEETSVFDSFKNSSVNYVETYLKAIHHLFRNYNEMMSKFFTEKEVRKFCYEKLSMHLYNAYVNKKYLQCVRLYFIGQKFVDMKKLNRYIYRMLTEK
uniref:glycosyltransferase family 2 protein n=1 Tax=uncultured Christiangramia sp. TaxID=503836 RepID=UPI0026325FA3|nr:glycosyltransferase family A protein [uncultured Christiangramia sp.]